MNELNSNAKYDDVREEQFEDVSALTSDELAFVGGGECVLNGF